MISCKRCNRPELYYPVSGRRGERGGVGIKIKGGLLQPASSSCPTNWAPPLLVIVIVIYINIIMYYCLTWIIVINVVNLNIGIVSFIVV